MMNSTFLAGNLGLGCCTCAGGLFVLMEVVAAWCTLLAQVSDDATRHDESVEAIPHAEIMAVRLCNGKDGDKDGN